MFEVTNTALGGLEIMCTGIVVLIVGMCLLQIVAAIVEAAKKKGKSDERESE